MSLITANTGSNNWNTNGAWVGGVQPTAADDVIIPASAVVTVPASTTVQCRSLTGSALGTLIYAATSSIINIGDGTAGAGNAALNLSSTFTLTLTGVGQMNFVSTSGTQQTITSGGKTLPTINFRGVGSSYLLSDDPTASGVLTVDNGIFDSGDHAMALLAFNTGGSSTRTIILGSSTISLSATTVAWNTSNTTGLTFSANTSIVTLTGNMTNANNIILAGANLNGLSFVLNGGGTATISTGGGAAIGSLTLTGTAANTNTYTFTSTITITGIFTVAGQSAINRVLVNCSPTGTARIITCSNAPSLSNVDFKDVKAAGAGGTWSGTSIGDCLGNSNITFTVNAGTSNGGNGVNRYWVGDSGNSNSTSHWSTSSGGSSGASVPLPQDDIYIDVNSFSTTNQRIQFNMPRIGRNIDMTGCNRSGTTVGGSSGQNNEIYGSLKYAGTAVCDANSTGGWTFAGRSSYDIYSNGGIQYGSVAFNAPRGTYTLQDDYLLPTGGNKGYAFAFGTFNANGFNLAGQTYTISSTMTSILMGSGVWTYGLTGAGTGWTMSAAASVLNAQTSTIVLVSSSSTRTFAGGGAKYNTLTYTVAGSTGQLTITGANYFEEFNFSDTSNVRSVAIPSSTLTIIKTLNMQGTSSFAMTLKASTPGTAAYLELVGQVSTVDYLAIADVISTLAYKFYAGANSTVSGVTSGVVLTAPVTQPYIDKSGQVAAAAATSRAHDFYFGQEAVAGEMLVLIAGFSGNPGTVTPPSGFTMVPNSPSKGTSSPYLYMFYKIASGGELGVSYSWTNSVNNNSILLALGGFAGTPTLDVYDDDNSVASTVTSLSTGAGVTPTASPSIAIAGWLGNNTLGATSSVNDSFLETRQVSAVIAMKSAARPLPSAVSVDPTMTWATARVSSSQLAVFKDVMSLFKPQVTMVM